MTNILTDADIRMADMMHPFCEEQKRPGIISYGLSSMGYDIRIGYVFKVFSPALCAVVDPKRHNPDAYIDVDLTPLKHRWLNGQCLACCAPFIDDPRYQLCTEQPNDYVMIPPNSRILGESVESFTMPEDVLGICLGKSTYARCGVIVPITPLEPGWTGRLTIELSNTSPLPAKVYCNEGVAQVLFLRAARRPEKTYKGKAGKYMAQAGLTVAKVD